VINRIAAEIAGQPAMEKIVEIPEGPPQRLPGPCSSHRDRCG
jgi:hypothetical protein